MGMSNHEELMQQMHAMADVDHQRCLCFSRWNRGGSMDALTAFSDETIALLNDALQGDHSDTIVNRCVLLFHSGQRKNLESVIRNIVLFANAEAAYSKLRGFSTHNSWKVFARVEKYARTQVCGMHNVVNTTPLQDKQILAVFHGAMALSQNFVAENNLPHFDGYVTSHTINVTVREEAGAAVINAFKKHPDESQRLYDFVAERGIVDANLLEAVVFFGDDELPSSLFGGVL